MSESPAELIRAEIARMTSAKALAYGYAAGSGEYEDTEQEMEQELRESYDQEVAAPEIPDRAGTCGQ